MKILGIYLENIQTYTQPTIIPFSCNKTIINGGNDKGKSVIKKALGMFAGIYNKGDFEGLINYNSDFGIIGIFLSNRTYLTVRFNKQQQEFFLLTWQMDLILKQWSEFSDDIPRYLGWVSVSGEELCINLAESNINVLVNTSPTTNTQIIQAISKVPDIDNRLSNLGEALIEAKDVGKQISIEKRTIENTSNMTMYNVDGLTYHFQSYEKLFNELNNLEKMIELFYYMCDLREIILKYSRNNLKLVQYICYDLRKLIVIHKAKYNLDNIINTVGTIKEIDRLYNLIKRIYKAKKLEEETNKIKNIIILYELKANYDRKNKLCYLCTMIQQITDKIKLIDDIFNLFNLYKTYINIVHRHYSIKQYFLFFDILQLNNIVFYSNLRNKINIFIQRLEVLKMKIDLYSIFTKIYYVQEKKREFKVCPLCGRNLEDKEASANV